MSVPSLSHLLHANNYDYVDRSSNAQSSPYSVVPSPTAPGPQPIPSPATRPAPTSAPSQQIDTPQQSGNPDSSRHSTPGARSHAANQSLYQCADCQRRYSRPEHLARHIQTHTLGKRFACQVCGKAFARADLLKRHAANHENDGDSTKKRRRTDTSPSAGRVSRACRACATARVKCEEAKPCTRCRNRGIDCDYVSEPGSAAAMHLLHLSANAHAHGSASLSPSPSSHTLPQNHSPAQYQPAQNGSIQAPPSQGQSYSNTPVTTSTPPFKIEEGQLPTPDATADQNPQDHFQQPYPNQDVVDLTRMPFSDFLRDVLYEPSMDPSRMEEPQGLAVLDFCDDTSLELTDIDFGMLDSWNMDGFNSFMGQTFSPQTDDSQVDMNHMRQKLVKIWTDSPWRWNPKGQSLQTELSGIGVPSGDTANAQFQETRKQLERVVPDKLENPLRDKIFAIVLDTCRNNPTIAKVASSFPTVELMDTLVKVYLAAHQCSVSGFVHFPTFNLNSQCPEWLATVAAAGAVMTPIPTLRRFGYALQEAVRVANFGTFEDDSGSISELYPVQTVVITYDIGLWSGNRRKMEISEAHLAVPVTMMRYRSRFQRFNYQLIHVESTDEGNILEEKWKKWVEKEAWKRLVCHCYIRDCQVSMTTLNHPAMSYAELSMPLPEARELWFAEDASEWKAQYLQRTAGQTKRPASLCDLIRDINQLTTNFQRLDLQLAMSVYLHGFWTLILEWRKLHAVHRSQLYPNSQNLLLTSRHQELCQSLHNFQVLTTGQLSILSVQESMIFHVLLMNLHVSMDDLQLFAGKEGEDQARKVYPLLQQWSESNESRTAIWHAGQILRQAKDFPPAHLKDFYAVAVHHAALALWAFGVVTKATRNQALSSMLQQEIIYLDDAESNQSQRFIGFGQGRPALRRPVPRVRARQNRTAAGSNQLDAYLDEPKACMEIAQDVLRANFALGQDLLPPIVENLCVLIKQLGDAAWAVGL